MRKHIAGMHCKGVLRGCLERVCRTCRQLRWLVRTTGRTPLARPAGPTEPVVCTVEMGGGSSAKARESKLERVDV